MAYSTFRISTTGFRALTRAAQVSRRSRTATCSMSSAVSPNHHILQYSYVPDIIEKRGPHREGHLTAIKKGVRVKLAEGKLIIAGAIAEPVDGGLLIFQNCTKEEVEQYAKADPYYQNNLIASYTIRPYLRVQ